MRINKACQRGEKTWEKYSEIEHNGNDKMKPLGIYIHVPFCVSKCGYCGFYSHVGTQKDYEDYTEKAVNSIKQSKVSAESFYVDSIFFGGGTPSLLSPSMIERILESLYSKFRITGDVEITVESNPGTLTFDKLKCYKSLGVNRLSLGVQSFSDEELKFIGRIHNSETARDTIGLCRDVGFENINLDLIFSLPGQMFEGWQKNLKEAVMLEPEHVSAYGLQLEEGTDFFKRFQAGEFSETTDELDRKMYHLTCEYLKKSGFNHYEISNWAKPSFECRHNLKYWTFQDYLGIGPSASSFINGTRFNVNENWSTCDMHLNSLKDSAGEFSFTALRTKDGIDFEIFEKKIGVPFWSVYGEQREKIEKLSGEGLIDLDKRGLRLTSRGIDISNGIMSIFV
ncbi:MAG: radical SAM family heme chaperone HemW [Anaerovoracaceae bacterium]|nr:radical SAM family heme chaperone HemW [Anaerovoracaceae bacterium]